METKNKFEKKAYRKQKRSQQKIYEEIGIVCTTKASKNLLICNAGLVNGLSRESVLKLCLPYGKIEEVIMLPGKSYCFIVFGDEQDCIKAYSALHGKAMEAQNNGPLYLSFSENVPETMMQDNSSLPPGLNICEDFVTAKEEDILISCIDFDENSASPNQELKHRQVKHFGFEFRYDINNVYKDCPLSEQIPSECCFISKRLEERGFSKQFCPDQLTVNKYLPGQGIPAHIDTHSAFEDPILSLSLGSDVIMDFRHSDGRCISVLLPRRSLLVMSGESRYAWNHGIVPRTLDIVSTSEGLTVVKRNTRLSFTFRKVLKGECDCSFSEYCDSFMKRRSSEQKFNKTIDDLEKMHVHNVYEEIALHFSDTRQKLWPNVLEFVQDLRLGSIMVDVGCGNGKYLGQNADIFEVGCDMSENLLDITKGRGFEVFKCNCLSLPLRSNIADACISIAVIHHLANEDRRLQALREMIRVLKVGGRALVYVWAKDQAKDKNKSSYLKQNRKNRKENSEINDVSSASTVDTSSEQILPLPVHKNRTQFINQDVLVPWKLKEHVRNDTSSSQQNEQSVFLRYYHVFENGELETLCKKLENVQIKKYYYDQGNWCVILEKEW